MMRTEKRYPRDPSTDAPHISGGKRRLISSEDPRSSEAVSSPMIIRSATTSTRSCSCLIFSLPDCNPSSTSARLRGPTLIKRSISRGDRCRRRTPSTMRSSRSTFDSLNRSSRSRNLGNRQTSSYKSWQSRSGGSISRSRSSSRSGSRGGSRGGSRRR